jgi:cell wall-associated NlpC family hydrolase
MSVMSPVSAVGQVEQLSSTLSNLGQELSSAATSGSFDSVLSQVNSEMSAIGTTESDDQTASAETPSSTLLDSASSTTPAWSAATGTSTGLTGSAVVDDAAQYLGVPYQWGGTNPATGLDCSGLVQRVYSDLGVNLPRTSEEQAQVGTPVDSLADAQPGDLVFFAGSDGTASSPGHVGIYIGNGMMIDAPHTGTDVQVQAVGNPVAIRRIIPNGDTSDGSFDSSALTASDDSSSLTSGPTDGAMDSLGVPADLQPLFQAAGSRYGVDPNLLAAVAKQESGFQTGAVSGAGAEGLMQLMPATAAGLGVSPFDPGQAIDGAAQLLSGYLQKYNGSVPLSLAAYNAGPGAVDQYGGVPPYSQTTSYVSNIMGMLGSVE